MHKFVHFNLFSASLCVIFLSDGSDNSVSVQVFCLFFLVIISGLFAKTSLSVCSPWFHNTVISSCSHTGLGTYEYQLSGTSIRIPYILSNANACRLYYYYYYWRLRIIKSNSNNNFKCSMSAIASRASV
jgi:hypothetical protein